MFAFTVAEHKTSQLVKLLMCATCLREHPKLYKWKRSCVAGLDRRSNMLLQSERLCYQL